jgi:hypothetical protein
MAEIQEDPRVEVVGDDDDDDDCPSLVDGNVAEVTFVICLGVENEFYVFS